MREKRVTKSQYINEFDFVSNDKNGNENKFNNICQAISQQEVVEYEIQKKILGNFLGSLTSLSRASAMTSWILMWCSL